MALPRIDLPLCASAIVDSVPAATLVRQPTPADEEAFVAAVRGSRDLHEPWIEPPDTAVRYAQYLGRRSKPEYAGWLAPGGTTSASR